MFGDLDTYQIDDVLTKQFVGRIGCSLQGETYIVPISFAYEDNYIYCLTKEGKKATIMRENPKVCFQVDEMKTMANWRSVVVQGRFEELTSKEDRTKALQILLNRYLPVMSSVTTHLGDYWPFRPEDVNRIEGIVFRIAINEKTGKFEYNGHSPHLPG